MVLSLGNAWALKPNNFEYPSVAIYINAMNSLSWEEVVKVNNSILDMRQADYESEKKTNKNPHYKGYTKGLPDRFEKFRIK